MREVLNYEMDDKTVLALLVEKAKFQNRKESWKKKHPLPEGARMMQEQAYQIYRRKRSIDFAESMRIAKEFPLSAETVDASTPELSRLFEILRSERVVSEASSSGLLMLADVAVEFGRV